MLPRTPRPLALGLSAALVTAGLALATPAASAAPAPAPSFGGTAYGTSASLGPISSGQSAAVSICSTSANRTFSNNVAQVNFGLAGQVGAVTNSIVTAKADGNASTTVTSETVGVNLLAGLVSASSIKVSASALNTGSDYSSDGTATFTELKIGGQTVVDPPVNAKITVRDLLGGKIAEVTINNKSTASGGGLYQTTVTGLRIDVASGNTLGLRPGTVIVGSALASLHTPTNFRAAGNAYATQADLAGVISSGMTAPVYLPCGGTDGATRTNSTVAVTLPGLASTGVASSSARSVEDGGSTSAILASKIAGLNLFGGKITADAITARSTATRDSAGKLSIGSESTFAGLKVNSAAFKVAAGKRTALDVPGLGSVTFNKTVPATEGVDTIALEIKLDTDQAGFKAGSVIQFAVAKARVAG